jgi:hypothetical protein
MADRTTKTGTPAMHPPVAVPDAPEAADETCRLGSVWHVCATFPFGDTICETWTRQVTSDRWVAVAKDGTVVADLVITCTAGAIHATRSLPNQGFTEAEYDGILALDGGSVSGTATFKLPHIPPFDIAWRATVS